MFSLPPLQRRLDSGRLRGASASPTQIVRPAGVEHPLLRFSSDQ